MKAPNPPLKVGDKVHVTDVNCGRGGYPKEGWFGEVVKLGSKLVTLTYGTNGEYTETFRIVERHRQDALHHRTYQTLAEHQEGLRRGAALNVLRDHDMIGGGARRLPIDKLEAIAEILERP